MVERISVLTAVPKNQLNIYTQVPYSTYINERGSFIKIVVRSMFL